MSLDLKRSFMPVIYFTSSSHTAREEQPEGGQALIAQEATQKQIFLTQTLMCLSGIEEVPNTQIDIWQIRSYGARVQYPQKAFLFSLWAAYRRMDRTGSSSSIVATPT